MYESNTLGHTTYWGTTYYSLKHVIREGRIHTISVSLTKGTAGMRLPNGVRVLRDCLTGLGLFADAGHFGDLGLSRVHTTIGPTRYSTIAAGGTLTSHPLARRLTAGRGTEGGHFLAKLGDFGEQLVHGYLRK